MEGPLHVLHLVNVVKVRTIQTKHSNDIGNFKWERMSQSPPGGNPLWGSLCVFNTCEHIGLYKSDPAHLAAWCLCSSPTVRSWPVSTHPRVLQRVLRSSFRAEAGVGGPWHCPARFHVCIHPGPQPASWGPGVMEQSLEVLPAASCQGPAQPAG